LGDMLTKGQGVGRFHSDKRKAVSERLSLLA